MPFLAWVGSRNANKNVKWTNNGCLCLEAEILLHRIKTKFKKIFFFSLINSLIYLKFLCFYVFVDFYLCYAYPWSWVNFSCILNAGAVYLSMYFINYFLVEGTEPAVTDIAVIWKTNKRNCVNFFTLHTCYTLAFPEKQEWSSLELLRESWFFRSVVLEKSLQGSKAGLWDVVPL